MPCSEPKAYSPDLPWEIIDATIVPTWEEQHHYAPPRHIVAAFHDRAEAERYLRIAPTHFILKRCGC